MKPIGKESVRSAVESIYPELPHRFSMMKLHAMVMRRIARPYLYLDTTRRKLMELREEGLISFENIDKARSIYHKIPVNQTMEV
jgi:hypothetical protein